MKILKRIFGICETPAPSAENSWAYADGAVTLVLDHLPELRHAGGAVRLEGGGLPARILVVHGSDGNFHAFANRCTHMGRRLDPLPGKERIECCSVSKSTFTYDGDPVSGAAKTSIKTYPVAAEGNLLRIRLG